MTAKILIGLVAIGLMASLGLNAYYYRDSISRNSTNQATLSDYQSAILEWERANSALQVALDRSDALFRGRSAQLVEATAMNDELRTALVRLGQQSRDAGGGGGINWGAVVNGLSKALPFLLSLF